MARKFETPPLTEEYAASALLALARNCPVCPAKAGEPCIWMERDTAFFRGAPTGKPIGNGHFHLGRATRGPQ